MKSKFSDKTKTITKEKTKPITKTKLPLEINLDQIMNPNPTIKLRIILSLETQTTFTGRIRLIGIMNADLAYAAVEQPGQPKRKINHKIVSVCIERSIMVKTMSLDTSTLPYQGIS